MSISRVFLSSTFVEMEPYREAATRAIEKLDLHCVRMESFPAADREISDFCEEKVRSCDVLVLLLGHLYGTPIPERGGISYTEEEFDTAVRLKRPILVFEAHPDAETRLAAALTAMRKGGLTYENQVERQELFLKKVHERHRLERRFITPTDLETWVMASLAKESEQRPGAPAYPGGRLPYLCDRSIQVDEFGKLFESGQAGEPQIYVLHGHEQEQHRQCVQRLVCLHVTYPQRGSSAALVGPPDDRAVVEWPTDLVDGEVIVFDRLKRHLFQAVDPRFKFRNGSTADAFCQLAFESGLPYLRFRHVLREESWGAVQPVCVRHYLPFWRDVAATFRTWPADKRPPRILVFFEILHRLTDTAAETAFGDRLTHALKAASEATGVPCRVLPRLPPVRQEDLDVWFGRYGHRVLAQYKTRSFYDWFPQLPLHMNEVESLLCKLLGVEDYGY